MKFQKWSDIIWIPLIQALWISAVCFQVIREIATRRVSFGAFLGGLSVWFLMVGGLESVGGVPYAHHYFLYGGAGLLLAIGMPVLHFIWRCWKY